MSYADYEARMDVQIRDAVLAHECQPVLFVGSGLSRRYFGAPDWHGALRNALSTLTDGGPAYEYYLQAQASDPIQIGTALAKRTHEWAWGSGRNHFPQHLFEQPDPDVFLKHLIASDLRQSLASSGGLEQNPLWSEIELLRSIRAHAIITTNFDQFLEEVFQGYEVIVGQKVLKYNVNSFGEIFKIHGCVSAEPSLLLTAKDYEDFNRNKQYLAAKLLTYFAEHPVFVFGYSFNDPNVRSVLGHVGELLADRDGIIPNVFYVKWDPEAATKASLPEEC